MTERDPLDSIDFRLDEGPPPGPEKKVEVTLIEVPLDKVVPWFKKFIQWLSR